MKRTFIGRLLRFTGKNGHDIIGMLETIPKTE
jgi:hypothetical protein